jgi:hypothetical protein
VDDDSPAISYGSPEYRKKKKRNKRYPDANSSALGLLKSNDSGSGGGLENVLGNADAIFIHQNSDVNISINEDNSKNLIPMK